MKKKMVILRLWGNSKIGQFGNYGKAHVSRPMIALNSHIKTIRNTDNVNCEETSFKVSALCGR